MNLKPLRIGVTLLVRDGQSLWENGIFQNCIFLVQLLRQCPGVVQAYIVFVGDGSAQAKRELLQDTDLAAMDLSDAAGQLDMVIEMSAQLSAEWTIAFRERGGKLVSMCVGNDFAIDAERLGYDLPAGRLVPHHPRDAVWTLPEYETVGAPYYAATFRAPVSILPHLWSAELLEASLRRRGDGVRFGYEPGRRRWRLAIMEPNLSIVKTCVIPFLVCEAAHRADADKIEYLHVFNTEQLKSNAVFSGVFSSMNLTRHELAGFNGRHTIVEVLTEHADALVCHQWENAQNYLYYEALHGGYPLIHNSHLIADCGWRYQGFDCEEGGRVLLEAIAGHDHNLQDYRRRADIFLRTLHPLHEANIHAYSEAIRRV
ncbi:DUF2827 domain-containing protein [Ottowia thiooxydans]|uniref:DUF2827 domain-containing protein n=1 Tax=Ottowia thiooxydans TaxID=219182 RepID=UPI000427F2FF|nr:DUF2827 domain-containing protein [Ottowia thiooxydans]